MSRVFPVLLAVLLVLCLPAMAVGGESQSGSSSPTAPATDTNNPKKPPGFNNTSAHLSLGTPERTETYTPSVSLSTTLEMDRNEIQSQKRAYTLDEQLANAQTSGEKEQALIQYKYELDSQLSSLRNKERATSKQFNGQGVTAEEYVQRLAILDARAEDIGQSIGHMEAKGGTVPRFSANGWQLRAKLLTIQGTVREYAITEIRGGATPQPIYVATTSNGVVLSTIKGNRYVREAFRADYRNPDTTNQVVTREAVNLTNAQYPWAVQHQQGQQSTEPRFGNGIWRSILPHTQGVVRAVLDGGTKKIYRETQYKSLIGEGHIPYGTAVRNDTTNLHLVVNRTYPGGPLRINVTDASGDPVDGRIEIGDTPVGNTEADGTLWTVSPRRKITVSATNGSETADVTLTPYGVTGTNSTSGPPEDIVGTAEG